jgi:hypothetical protein
MKVDVCEPKETSQVNLSREIHRKLINIIGSSYIKEEEKNLLSLSMEKYILRKIISKEQVQKENYTYNTLTFQREQKKDPRILELKIEVRTKTEASKNL